MSLLVLGSVLLGSLSWAQVSTIVNAGPGSLREALANATDGDTITFDENLNGRTITLTAALPDITVTNLTLDASDLPDQIVVERSREEGTPEFRIFTHLNNTGTLTIDSLIIRNGSTDSDGGGIYSDGNVTLSNSTVSSNHADSQGGGIYSFGNVIVENSRIVGNNAESVVPGGGTMGDIENGFGGGIFSGGNATFANSTMSGNSAGWNGGGINGSGHIVVENSAILGNRAGSSGGGIHSDISIRTPAASILVKGSTISGNSSGSNGGGISGGFTITIEDSIVTSNITRLSGGGIRSRGDITLKNSTISGNSAGFAGGGIASPGRRRGGKLTLESSLVIGNSAGEKGGGISKTSGHTIFMNSTVAGNSAGDEGGGIIACNALQNAIDNCPGVTVTLNNSLVLNNNASEFSEIAVYGDIVINNSVYGFAAGESSGDSFVGLTASDVFVAPEVVTFRPTRNGDYRLAIGSPAVDAGDDSLVPNSMTTDLDGNARIQGAAVDMGAYEAAPATTRE